MMFFLALLLVVTIRTVSAEPVLALQTNSTHTQTSSGNGYSMSLTLFITHQTPASNASAFYVNVSLSASWLSVDNAHVDSNTTFIITHEKNALARISPDNALTTNDTATVFVQGTLLNPVTRIESLAFSWNVSYYDTTFIAYSTSTHDVIVCERATNIPPSLSGTTDLSVFEDDTFTLSTLDLDDADFTLEADDFIMTLNVSTTRGTLHLPASHSNDIGVRWMLGTPDVSTDSVQWRCHLHCAREALRHLVFQPEKNFGGDNATVFIYANDNGASGAGGAKELYASFSIYVWALKDAPEVAGDTTIEMYEDTVLSLSSWHIIHIDAVAGDNISLVVNTTYGYLNVSHTTFLKNVSYTLSNSSRTLSLLGDVSDVNRTLMSVTYSPTAHWTLYEDGMDTLVFVVADETSSTTHLVDIEVYDVNDAPTLSITPSNTPIIINEDEATSLDVVVWDYEVSRYIGATITVILSSSHGTLTLNNTVGLYVSTASTNLIVLHGDLFSVNAALSPLQYTGNIDMYGNDEININVSDNGVSGSGGEQWMNNTVSVTLTPINDAPTLNFSSSLTTSNSSSTTNNANVSFTVVTSDVDAVSNATYTMTVTSSDGIITLSSLLGLVFTNNSNVSSSTMMFNGSIDAINAAMFDATFTPYFSHTTTDCSMMVTVNDNGFFGSGGAQLTTLIVPINVYNTVSLLEILMPSNMHTKQFTNYTFPASSLAVVDAELEASFGAMMCVSMSVLYGTLTLAQRPGLLFTVGDGINDTTMTFETSFVYVNAALDALTYLPHRFFYGNDTFTMTATAFNATHNATSTSSRNNTIAVTPDVNNVVITCDRLLYAVENRGIGLGGSVSFRGNKNIDTNMTMTTIVSHGALSTSSIPPHTFFIVVGNHSSTLELHGNFSSITNAFSLLEYTSETHFNGIDTLIISTSYETNVSASCTIPVIVEPSNDAPVISAPALFTVIEDEVTALKNIGFSDPDDGEIPHEMYTLNVSAANGTFFFNAFELVGVMVVVGTGHADAIISLRAPIASLNSIFIGHHLSYKASLDFFGADIITVCVEDEGLAGDDGVLNATAYVAVSIISVADAPVVSTESSHVVIDEDTSEAIVFTFYDVDSLEGVMNVTANFTTFKGATLSLSNVTSGQSIVSTTSSGNVTTLIVSAPSFTSARNITLLYSPYTNWNTQLDSNDIIHAIFTDNDGASATLQVSVAVTAVNDAPVLQAPASITAHEDTLTYVTLNVSDVDNGDTIASGFELHLSTSSGLLSLHSTSGLSLIIGLGLNDASVIALGSLDNINNALNAFTLLYSSFVGVDTLVVSVCDRGSTGINGMLWHNITVPVHVAATNAAPTLTLTSINEPILIIEHHIHTLNVTLDDDDDEGSQSNGNFSVTLYGVNVMLSLPLISALASNVTTFAANASYSASFVSVRNALSNISILGDTSGLASLHIIVTDDDDDDEDDDDDDDDGGGATTVHASYDVYVVNVNDAPTLSLTCPLTTSEDTVFALPPIDVVLDDTVSAEATSLYRVLVEVQHGTLSLHQHEGAFFVRGDATNDSVHEFELHATALHDAMSSLTYCSALNWHGNDTLSIMVSDVTDTTLNASLTCDIHVTPVDDVITLVMPSSFTATEDVPLALLALNITDYDARTNTINATVTVQHAVLSVSATSGVTHVTPDVADTDNITTITLIGSVSAVRTSLSSALTYTSNTNFNGYDTIRVRTAYVGAEQRVFAHVQTRSIIVSSVNDAPTITLPYTMTEVSASAHLVINGIVFDDVDADETYQHVLLVRLDVLYGSMSLNSTGGVSLSVGDGDDDATIVMTGALNALNTAVAGLVYVSGDNGTHTDTLSVFISDNGFTGDDNVTLSSSDSIDISVTASQSFVRVFAPVQIFVDEDSSIALGAVNLTANANARLSSFTCVLSCVSATLSVLSTHNTLLGAAVTNATRVTFNTNFTSLREFLSSALSDVIVRPTHDFNGMASVDIAVNTTTAHHQATVDVHVNAVNDAPVLKCVNTTFAAFVDDTINITGCDVVDVDVDDAYEGMLKLSVTAVYGHVSMRGAGLISDTTLNDTNTHSMTVYVAATLINNALNALCYIALYAVNDTLTLHVSDGGAHGCGGELSTAANITVRVEQRNSAPTLSVPAQVDMLEDEIDAHVAGIVVDDIDVTLNMSATIVALYGALTLSNTCNVSHTLYNNVSNTMVSVNGALDDVAACLTTLRYTPPINLNGIHPRMLTLTVDDGGGSDVHHQTLFATAVIAVNISAVNDAPRLMLPTKLPLWGASPQFGAVLATGWPLEGVTVTDVDVDDTYGASLRVHVSVVNGTLTLRHRVGLWFSDNKTGMNEMSMEFTGRSDLVALALANTSLLYANTMTCEDGLVLWDTLSISVSDGGNTGSGGVLTTNASTSISLICA